MKKNRLQSRVQEVQYNSVEIGKKIIEFRNWTTKDERLYLSLLEKKGSEITDKDLFDTLIKPCIKEPDIVLTVQEQKMLLIYIRSNSISKTISDKITCKECKETTDVEIDLLSICDYKGTDFKDITISDIKYTFADIKSNKAKEKLSMKDGGVNYVYNEFLLHINEIEIDGEIYDDFTFNEIMDFIDSLPTNDFDQLLKAYQGMIDSLEIKYNFECKCSHKEVIDYTRIPNFLWK